MSKIVQLRRGIGAFEIRRDKFTRLWQAGHVRIEHDVIPSTRDEDPDAFTEHGGVHAIDRWMDDGGHP